MDKQRSKILIKKINSLFSSIEMEESTLSAIERDLMLKYIRDLYEEFVDEGPTTPVKRITPTQPKPAAPELTSTILSQPRFSAPEETTTPKPTTKVEPSTTAAPVVPPAPTPIETPPPPEPPVMKTPVYNAPESNDDTKVSRLFAFKQAKELSEKLSQQPIKDLQTALSINDKLLYTNELFGRQHNILNDTLQALNRFNHMDQAKQFLMSLAEQYDWAGEEREDIARSFIKTIRRRYQ